MTRTHPSKVQDEKKHKPKRKQKQTINKNKVKALSKLDPWQQWNGALKYVMKRTYVTSCSKELWHISVW